MYAVIKTGGKQYRVKVGDVISVEKLQAEKGQTVSFDQVLLLEDGEQIQVGTPCLEKARVTAEVLEEYKDDKVIIFKKKRRKGYRRKKGHRQVLAKVKITGIYPDGQVVEEVKTEAVAGEEKEAVKKAAARKPAARKTETAGKKARSKKSEQPEEK